MDFAALQVALREWVMSGTGLGDKDVLWSHPQAGTRPNSRPYAVLQVLLTQGDGQDGEESEELDEPLEPDDDGVGREMKITTSGPRVMTVRVQTYSARAVSVAGAPSAHQLAEAARIALRRPAIHAGLVGAGLGPLEAGPVNPVPALLDAVWEGRASVDARFFTTASAEDFATYIEEVDVEGELDEE